jgi:Pentapeptide repeats (9 copies)
VKQLLTVLLLAGLSLSACRQPQPVYLPACTFCDNADSSGNDYPATINLQYVYWGTKTCFKDANFGDTTIFKQGIFTDTAVFTDASFTNYVDFSHAVFSNAVYFDDVSFGKNVYFENVRFPHYAKFTNLQHTDSVAFQFTNAILPDTIDFSQNSALKCKIDLTTADFDTPVRSDTTSGDSSHPHYIFLFNTDISKFKLDYFHFRLLLPDSTITPSYGANRQKISKDQKEVMYEALLANFKNNGQDESYKRLDIEYQTFKSKNSWAPFLAWLQTIWWNFGYDKEYVFAWIGISLLVFSFINSFWLPTLNEQVYEVFKPADIDKKPGYGNRLWQSVIYTGNIFFRLTLDRDCMKFKKFWPTLYFFVVYVLGVLCLGYLANFILQQ